MKIEQRLHSTSRGEYLAEAFGHLDLFQHIDFGSIADLISQCELVHVTPQTTLLAEGLSNRAIYQIVSGRVEVKLHRTDDGPRLILESGACVGELSILSQHPVSADVVALEQTRLLMINEETLWALVQGCHQFACNLLEVMAGRLRDSNARLRRSVHAEQQALHAARIDALTGLYNRRWLDEVLPSELERCVTGELPLSLILIDIDCFKDLNDQHGHLVGDEVLRIVGLRLANAVREIGMAVRFGGEEFAMVLPGLDLPGAAAAAEACRELYATSRLATSAGPLSITVSAGVSTARGGATAHALLTQADQALYLAKHQGRNQVCCAPSG